MKSKKEKPWSFVAALDAVSLFVRTVFCLPRPLTVVIDLLCTLLVADDSELFEVTFEARARDGLILLVEQRHDRNAIRTSRPTS